MRWFTESHSRFWSRVASRRSQVVEAQPSYTSELSGWAELAAPVDHQHWTFVTDWLIFVFFWCQKRIWIVPLFLCHRKSMGISELSSCLMFSRFHRKRPSSGSIQDLHKGGFPNAGVPMLDSHKQLVSSLFTFWVLNLNFTSLGRTSLTLQIQKSTSPRLIKWFHSNP